MIRRWWTRFLCQCCKKYLYKRLYVIAVQLELANQAKRKGLLFPTRRYTYEGVTEELKALLQDLHTGKES